MLNRRFVSRFEAHFFFPFEFFRLVPVCARREGGTALILYTMEGGMQTVLFRVGGSFLLAFFFSGGVGVTVGRR